MGSCSSLSIVNLLNRTFTFDQSKSPVKHPHPINSPTMPTGSCFCDGVKIEYSGEPAMTALCHCADCRHISGGVDGMRIIKAGVIDDVNVINNSKPGAELFAPERINWVAGIEGAGQVESMPPPS